MSYDTYTVDRLPTRTSVAVAALVALGVVVGLLWQFEPVRTPAALGAVGVASFAVSLWALDADSWRGLGTMLAGLLSVAVSGGFLVGTLGPTVLLLAAYFPMDGGAGFRTRWLLVISTVCVVVASFVAVLGLALGVRSTVDRAKLRDYYWVAVRTGLVPAAVSLVLLTRALLAYYGQTTTQALLADRIGGLQTWLLAPGGWRLHLASLGLLALLATWCCRRLLMTLPLAELLADGGDGTATRDRIDRISTVLGYALVGLVLGSGLALVLELGQSQPAIRRLLGPALYDLLVTLSTARLLRLLLVTVLVVGVPAIAVVGTVRRLSSATLASLGQSIGPYVSGGLLVAAGTVLATPSLPRAVSWTGEKLPGELGQFWETTATSVLEFYGADAIAILLLAVLVTLTAVLALALWFLLAVGYLSERTAGFSLAGAGLFAASAFAATLATPTWLVFAGFVGAVVVYDAGEYATTLGREVGRRAPSRSTELVHVGASLLVGLLGAGVALALLDVRIGTATLSATTVGAFVAGVVAVVSFVTALH